MIKNGLLSTAALLLSLLCLELGVRMLGLASDTLEASADRALGAVRVADQQGVYRRYGVVAPFRINHHGWNSAQEYSAPMTGNLTIAVIGDSYVEAMQVAPDRAFPELLPALVKDCGTVTSYRFGIGGASLAHYEALIAEVAWRYQPDLIVVNLFANDFDESLLPAGIPYLWRYRAVPEGFERVEPAPLPAQPLLHALNESAAWRLLGITDHWTAIYPLAAGAPPRAEVERFIPFVLARYQQIAQAYGARLLLMAEPDRAVTLYGEVSPYQGRDYAANIRIVQREADRLGIEMLDLTPGFQQAWNSDHQRLEFAADWHWNEYGHQVVAQTVSKWVQTHVCAERRNDGS